MTIARLPRQVDALDDLERGGVEAEAHRLHPALRGDGEVVPALPVLEPLLVLARIMSSMPAPKNSAQRRLVGVDELEDRGAGGLRVARACRAAA